MNSHDKNLNSARVRGVSLVVLMLASLFVAMVPAVTASHVETYSVQRNPVDIASGDLDCDGDADIVSASEMGMLISVLYNDDGDFSDREDLWVSANSSRRAFWFDMADANDVEIGDIDGDGANDLIFFRQNVWVASSTTPPLGNMTVLWGDCNERVSNGHDLPPFLSLHDCMVWRSQISTMTGMTTSSVSFWMNPSPTWKSCSCVGRTPHSKPVNQPLKFR